VTKPNDILRNLSRWIVENPFITTNNAHTAFVQITYLEKEIWQEQKTTKVELSDPRKEILEKYLGGDNAGQTPQA